MPNPNEQADQSAADDRQTDSTRRHADAATAAVIDQANEASREAEEATSRTLTDASILTHTRAALAHSEASDLWEQALDDDDAEGEEQQAVGHHVWQEAVHRQAVALLGETPEGWATAANTWRAAAEVQDEPDESEQAWANSRWCTQRMERSQWAKWAREQGLALPEWAKFGVGE